MATIKQAAIEALHALNGNTEVAEKLRTILEDSHSTDTTMEEELEKHTFGAFDVAGKIESGEDLAMRACRQTKVPTSTLQDLLFKMSRILDC
jgi:hypothetical protein